MKNLRFLLIISIFFTPLFLFGQSKLVMGGGLIISNIEGVISNSFSLESNASQEFKPFLGFSYESELLNKISLSANLNYSRNKILSNSINNDSIFITFSPALQVRFVHISGAGLLNYKIFSGLTNSNFMNGFKIGIGLNIDTFRDFEDDNLGFITQESSRYQIGLLFHTSWEYKKFRLSYNIMNSMKMFGNHENLIQSTDWRTLSASYIYTLSE